jgi:hypothetical protein
MEVIKRLKVITITEAAKLLKVTDAAIYLGTNYQQYIVRCKDTFNLFDIEKYRVRQEYERNFLSRIKLLLEYLIFEEGLRYKDLATPIGVTAQTLHSHKLSYSTGIKLIQSLDEAILDRFDNYYGFTSKWYRKGLK